MLDVDDFIEQGHRKVIEHYRRLRDTATSEVERERLQRRMVEEYQALKHHVEQRLRHVQRAA
jgi:hypothetical protein